MQQNTWSFPAPQDKQFGLLHPHPLNNCILLHPHPYCVFVWFFLRTCVPNVASFSGLSFLIAPSVFSNVYLLIKFISGKKLAVNIQSTFHSLDTCVGIAIPLQSIKLIVYIFLLFVCFVKLLNLIYFIQEHLIKILNVRLVVQTHFHLKVPQINAYLAPSVVQTRSPKQYAMELPILFVKIKVSLAVRTSMYHIFYLLFFLHYQHQFRLVLFSLILCCYFFLFLKIYPFFVSPVTFVLEGETYMC